jgi:putative peptidoglycan lipid II flippase
MFTLKVAVAVALMGAALYFAMGDASWWFNAPWQKKLPAVLGLVALGVAVYGAALAVLGFRPRDFSRRGAV